MKILYGKYVEVMIYKNFEKKIEETLKKRKNFNFSTSKCERVRNFNNIRKKFYENFVNFEIKYFR